MRAGEASLAGACPSSRPQCPIGVQLVNSHISCVRTSGPAGFLLAASLCGGGSGGRCQGVGDSILAGETL